MPITGSQKALMVSRLNKLRLGAGRLDYYVPKLLLTINGTDRRTATRIRDLSIRDYLDGTPNTATLRVDGFTPVKGHEIKIALGELDAAHFVFCGHIIHTTQVYEGQKPANVAWDLQCISYEWLLQRRKVIKRYTSQSATAIVIDLMASFTAGFTTKRVAANLATIDEITFTNEDVPTALDRIAKRIGAYWYVDYAKDLHFFLSDDHAAGDITSASPRSARAIVAHTDLSPVRTRVYVEGAGSSALADVAVGQTTIPVDDSGHYNASGGTVVVGQQRVTYTGKSALDGTGSKVGGKTGLAPGACTASVVTGTSGNVPVTAAGHDYKVTFVINGGETEGGATSGAAVISHVSVPGSSGSGSGTTGGSLVSGALYGWAVSYVTAAGETPPSPAGTITLGGSDTAISLTSIPTSGDGRVTARRIYRTDSRTGAYGLDTTINNNTSTTATLTKADSALGVGPPTVNTSGSGQVSLTNIPLGPAGTTARRIYRVENQIGAPHRYLATLSNNSTTTYTDNTAVAGLGDVVPTESTVPPLAGDTSLPVQDLAQFNGSGGWVQMVGQLVRYTGRSAASGSGTLTGVPASGIGSITAAVPYDTPVLNAPHLTGVPASGAGSVLYAFNQGEPVNLLVTRNDATAQSNMAGFVGGDGIHEEYIADNRLSETEATARGDAYLTLAKDPLVTMTYQTRDQTSRSGRAVTFSLGAPTSISGTFKIQSVTITEFDVRETTFPLRAVEASSRRFSLEAMLRLIKAAA